MKDRCRKPKVITTQQEPYELLADLSREDLVALVMELVQEQPQLEVLIRAVLSRPASAHEKKRKRRMRLDEAAYRREVRCSILLFLFGENIRVI